MARARLAGAMVAAALAPLAGCGEDGGPQGDRPASRAAQETPAGVPRTRAPAEAAAPTATPKADRPALRRRLKFSARPLSDAVLERIVGSSWHEGCPVPLDDLRYLRVPYLGFDGRLHLGELVVNEDAVAAMEAAFASLLERRLPIRRMRLVDDYGASDFDSIERDNTSAFNCRRITGGTGWSEHAYGRAIDVNPIENPYLSAAGTTVHPASEPFIDRTEVRRGMAVAGGAYVEDFAAVGWQWGGDWSGIRDLQHFSPSGR